MEGDQLNLSGQANALGLILSSLQSLQLDQGKLFSAVDAINGRLNAISGIQGIKQLASNTEETKPALNPTSKSEEQHQQGDISPVHHDVGAQPTLPVRRSSITSRIILTTYREPIPSCLQ